MTEQYGLCRTKLHAQGIPCNLVLHSLYSDGGGWRGSAWVGEGARARALGRMREARDMGGNILPGRTGREVNTGMASDGDGTKEMETARKRWRRHEKDGDGTKEMFSTGVPTKDGH